jgi:hypothetical protein
MRAGVAVRAAVFQLAMRAGLAVHALAFHLAMRTGVAGRAVMFHLAMWAGVAVRALAFQLSMRARAARHAVVFPLIVPASFSPCHGRREITTPRASHALVCPRRARRNATRRPTIRFPVQKRRSARLNSGSSRIFRLIFRFDALSANHAWPFRIEAGARSESER